MGNGFTWVHWFISSVWGEGKAQFLIWDRCVKGCEWHDPDLWFLTCETSLHFLSISSVLCHVHHNLHKGRQQVKLSLQDYTLKSYYQVFFQTVRQYLLGSNSWINSSWLVDIAEEKTLNLSEFITYIYPYVFFPLLCFFLYVFSQDKDSAWWIYACLYENWIRNWVKVLFLATDEMLLTCWKSILIYMFLSIRFWTMMPSTLM